MIKIYIKKYYLYMIIAFVTLGGLLMTYIPGDEEIQAYDPLPAKDVEPIIEYIYVDIKGYVYNPGVYKLEKDTRLFQLITQAGGLIGDADEQAINLSMLLKDEQVIYIPSINEIYLDVNEDTIDDFVDDGETTININTSSKTALETLPGIGPSTAQSIIDYREENGEFMTIEDIINVPGIGESTYNDIKDLITT